MAERAKPKDYPHPLCLLVPLSRLGADIYAGHVAAGKKAPDLPTSISAVKRVANESNKARPWCAQAHVSHSYLEDLEKRTS